MLKKVPSGVLGSSQACDVAQGYASAWTSPAALLDDLFEHPTLEMLHDQIIRPSFLRLTDTTALTAANTLAPHPPQCGFPTCDGQSHGYACSALEPQPPTNTSCTMYDFPLFRNRTNVYTSRFFTSSACCWMKLRRGSTSSPMSVEKMSSTPAMSSSFT